MTDPIRWQHFESTTLATAKAEDRPILMVLTVPWCQFCKELMATTFTDTEVVDRVNNGFIPVHVDAERRPDVNQRFGTGAWPTIAWLSPEGELIAHHNFLDAAGLAEQLDRVRTAWQEDRDAIEQGLADLHADSTDAPPTDHGKLRHEMTDDVGNAILEKLDRRHGGFGEGAKFPHPEALDFALVQVSKRSDERMREAVTLTLDRMMGSPLHDHVDGGFFRFSRTPDWHTPNYEKLLDQNALVLRAYLEAYQLFENDAYRRAAEGIVEWMMTTMRNPETGAFAGSQNGDHDYFTTGGSERSRRQSPSLDGTVYCHANAIAVSSLLKAAAVLSQPHWHEHAVTTLRFLLDNLYDGREVYHYWDGTYHLPGMLADQAFLIRALIDAAQNTGDSNLLQPAEAIADRVIERQKAQSGGFFDILQDQGTAGSMRRRNRSILDNAQMAESLVRLSYLTRRPDLFQEAIGALESFAGDYREYGYYVAGYGRAVDLVFYEPLFITIVGDRNDERAVTLRRAALAPYVPSRIVQSLDPDHDPVLLERSGLEVRDEPTAWLAIGSTVQSMANTATDLLAAIAKVEAERRAGLS